MRKALIFRDDTDVVEVFDRETQLSTFFDSIGEILTVYKNSQFIVLNVKHI